jgi:hypothetical protein
MKEPLSLAKTLCGSFLVAALAFSTEGADTFVRPSRGGGLDTNAPMIHVNIFYDYGNNTMSASLQTDYDVPHLTPLPEGYAFDPSSNYFVLSGKAYSMQYAWNPGGIFSPPAGGAIWIECLGSSSGLETYDGPGNKNEDPPRPYAPIFGTSGSPMLWQWYGRMAHNSYAIQEPTEETVWASYRVYFGHASSGAPMEGYDDATVTLNWTVTPVPEPGTPAFIVIGTTVVVLSRRRLGWLPGRPDQFARTYEPEVRE